LNGYAVIPCACGITEFYSMTQIDWWTIVGTLAEELEQARKNIEQVGDYLNKKEWMAVRIRAQEIMTSCRESLTRWPDGLSENRKNDVLSASALVRSIADEAAAPDVSEFRLAKLKRLSNTQLQAAELLSGALGEARNRVEEEGE
jgi:hypothetical protein